MPSTSCPSRDTKFEFRLLERESVNAWWEFLVPFLEPALDEDLGDLEVLREGLLTSKLFAIMVGNIEIVGVIISKFHKEGDVLILSVVTCVGHDMKSWQEPALQMLENMARKAGAGFITFETTRKAERFCTHMGFKQVATVFRKELT